MPSEDAGEAASIDVGVVMAAALELSGFADGAAKPAWTKVDEVAAGVGAAAVAALTTAVDSAVAVLDADVGVVRTATMNAALDANNLDLDKVIEMCAAIATVAGATRA